MIQLNDPALKRALIENTIFKSISRLIWRNALSCCVVRQEKP